MYVNSLFGLKKDRIGSKVIFDISNELFSGFTDSEKRYFNEFDIETETVI